MKLKQTIFLALILSAFTLCSCVHEWPEAPEYRPAKLTVRVEGVNQDNRGWEILNHNVKDRSTRQQEEVMARYTYEVYPAGTSKQCVLRSSIMQSDLSLKEFTAEIRLPEGEYDIYMWCDYVKADGTPLYYDDTDFRGITYLEPYRGNNIRKDAFNGNLRVDVPHSISEDVNVEGTIVLRRPLAAVAFVATDLRDFLENEITRKGLPKHLPSDDDSRGEFDIKAYLPDFDRYSVKLIYTGFLPSVFDMLLNRPVDSRTGVSLTCPIAALNLDEVLCGFDFFFCNGEESSILIAMEVYDSTGELVARTPSYDIPVKRSGCTVVRGDFLTAKSTSGVGISPGFDGSFNIEIY